MSTCTSTKKECFWLSGGLKDFNPGSAIFLFLKAAFATFVLLTTVSEKNWDFFCSLKLEIFFEINCLNSKLFAFNQRKTETLFWKSTFRRQYLFILCTNAFLFRQSRSSILFCYRSYSIMRWFAYKTGPIFTTYLHSSEWTIFYLRRPRLLGGPPPIWARNLEEKSPSCKWVNTVINFKLNQRCMSTVAQPIAAARLRSWCKRININDKRNNRIDKFLELFNYKPAFLQSKSFITCYFVWLYLISNDFKVTVTSPLL